MTPVKVVERDGKYILQTMFGNPIGPRLWGAEPRTDCRQSHLNLQTNHRHRMRRSCGICTAYGAASAPER